MVTFAPFAVVKLITLSTPLTFLLETFLSSIPTSFEALASGSSRIDLLQIGH